MYKKFFWKAIFISLVVAGCAKEQIYQSKPGMQTVGTQDYEVKLEPLRAEGYNYYNQFRCTFTNKTDGVIPAGENGMSIAVLKDGKVLRKKIIVTITQE